MIYVSEGLMVDLEKVQQDYNAYAVKVVEGVLTVLVDDPENTGYVTWIDITECERIITTTKKQRVQ